MIAGDAFDPDHGHGRPLEGIRVLALEQMQSLPYATQLLARLGADVVKIEHPERGDLGRGAQPAIADPHGRPVGATFLRNNLSKRSVAVDLKHPEGAALVRRLAPRFDVVAENFKPGTVERFGLGWDDLVAVHPRLVWLSISGFGNLAPSPYAHWPAFAPVAEAMAGLYAINRGPDEPVKVSPVGALGDTGTALFAVIGVLAALRQRDATGRPQRVDVAMFDAMVAFADIVPNYWSLGKDPRTPTLIINHGFALRRGEIVIQVGREHQFARLAEAVGHPEWVDDERFATRQGWLEHLEVIRAGVRDWAGDRTPVAAADALAAAGIAAAPVFEAEDLVHDDHVAAHEMLVGIPRPDGAEQPVLTPGNPVKIADLAEDHPSRPPWLGEHTEDVLSAELGLDPDEIADLAARGVIGREP